MSQALAARARELVEPTRPHHPPPCWPWPRAPLVPPDAGYADYVDLRTLGLLFSLMTIMAALSRAGVFRAAGEALISRLRSGTSAILGLVLLPFAASMLATNDVALIAFVPFALLVLRMLGLERSLRLHGGHDDHRRQPGQHAHAHRQPPEPLPLLSASGMGFGEFVALMLPYALLSAALLVASVLAYGALHDGLPMTGRAARPCPRRPPCASAPSRPGGALCPRPGRGVPRGAGAALVAATVAVALAFDRRALAEVDLAFSSPSWRSSSSWAMSAGIGAVDGLLSSLVSGNELAVSVAASQVVSNVPAALLLSGFSSAWPALIVGTNIGGLGTLIASMASLISYKQIVSERPGAAGGYLLRFTAANVAFLGALMLLALLLMR